MRRYTEEERAFFLEYIPNHSAQEVADEFNRRFEYQITAKQAKSFRENHKLRSGRDCRFNKDSGGFKSEEHRRKAIAALKKNAFKKGNVPPCAVDKPIGYEAVNTGGYIKVKVADKPVKAGDNWRLKHHLIYEREHGQIPDGCMILFADHDKRNFDPDNLVAVPRSLHSFISANGIGYWNRESLETAMNIAKLAHIKYGILTRPKKCSRCGVEFKPRYKEQARCDSCIESHKKERSKA